MAGGFIPPEMINYFPMPEEVYDPNAPKNEEEEKRKEEEEKNKSWLAWLFGL